MKHMLLLLALILGMGVATTGCANGDKYEYIYLREVTVDNEPADEALYADVMEELSETGLPILDKEAMRELTPQQRIRTMKVSVDIDYRRNKLDVDLEIENLQTDRDIWDTSCKVDVNDPEALDKALTQVLYDAVEYIRLVCK